MNQRRVVETIYNRIIKNPGIPRDQLKSEFQLTDYKLKKAFRFMSRDVDDWILVDDDQRGVWIVGRENARCQGVVWSEEEGGQFSQCKNAPSFPDGRCYEHSMWENADMTAFERKLSYLAGPRNPTAYSVGQLSISVIEGLMQDLYRISPKTLLQKMEWGRRASLLKSARAFAIWKDNLRKREGEQWDWVDPELGKRHNRSSINPFEYSLKKQFAILEVVPEATKEEVLKAWRRLARKYHPDREGGDEENMKAVNYAKEKIFRIKRWDKASKRK
jgi:DnaJ-domain-containing protein 1